jgi:hypothetical protein
MHALSSGDGEMPHRELYRSDAITNRVVGKY